MDDREAAGSSAQPSASEAPTQRSYGYAVLNDAVDAYSRLSYYVSRDQQERQLLSEDLRMIDCVGRCDRPVMTGGLAYRGHELNFVAQLNACDGLT